MALVNLSIYYTWKNIKSEYNNNKFTISAPTWNETFDLLDSSYSISDIQDYFEFIIKKHETLTENPSKLMNTATITGIDAAKTASKRLVVKTAEATGDLIGNKIADEITSISKPKEKPKEKSKESEEIYIPP